MSTVSRFSLSSILPRTTQPADDWDTEKVDEPVVKSKLPASVAPPYGHRKGWMPRKDTDFDDGGAFPECHMAQFPLGLGRKRDTSNTISVTLDAQGKVKYDVLARQGHGKDKIVYSKFKDLVPKGMKEGDSELEKPDEETTMETTEKTREALESLTQCKISAAMPVRAAEKPAAAQYIRYTASQQGVAYASGAKQRIVRMVEAQVDPMEPPKFKINQKIPRGPPSPPAPVMHSPNRKVSVKEQQEWKIPPCISNWKNPKGYTIPLDKRVAADGRGLQNVHVNENFAKVARALCIADKKAREAIELRAQIEKKQATKKKEETEQSLRRLADQARLARAGVTRPAEKPVEEDEVTERDEIRKDRQKDRQRERNIARAAPDKRNKLLKDRDRNISEKIALGLPATGGAATGEAQFDSRLFNQSKGMDTGFGEDDSYNVYSEPWRTDKNMASTIYRPRKNDDLDSYGESIEKIAATKRFIPDRGFAGTHTAKDRSGPVAYEEDPFNLDSFISEAKVGRKRTGGTDETDRKKRK